jgi:hypothetical protein
MKTSMGAACPQSPECCPQSIGITVRNQLELLSAIAGILHGLPSASTAAWIFVVSPPRERPIA